MNLGKRLGKIGGKNAAGTPAERREGPVANWAMIARNFGELELKPEQLRTFPQLPGSDDEPWDVLLSMLAADEHTALGKLAARTGLPMDHEPRLNDSAARFYELVPASVARERLVAGIESDGTVMTVKNGNPIRANEPITITL